MVVNTAMQKWPILCTGSQQSTRDATTGVEAEIISTESTPAGSGSECPMCVALVMDIGCAVGEWTRWCMPTRPAAMATVSSH